MPRLVLQVPGRLRCPQLLAGTAAERYLDLVCLVPTARGSAATAEATKQAKVPVSVHPSATIHVCAAILLVPSPPWLVPVQAQANHCCTSKYTGSYLLLLNYYYSNLTAATTAVELKLC